MRLGIVDKLLDRMERRGVRHKHEMGKPGDKRDRRKIRNRIVAQRAVETGVHRKGPAVEQDCVSVGPPAATDTMMRTGFVGYPAFDVCARAASGHAAAVVSTAISSRRLIVS